MKRDLKKSDIYFDDSFNKIYMTIERIAHITQGLRSFARDGSQDEFKPELVMRLLRETISFCDQRMKNIGLDFIILNEAEDIVIECQALSLKQVFLNLINNALDATIESEYKMIQIEVIVNETNVIFKFSDSGAGIDSETKTKLFEPFYSTKGVSEGSGLGLSISSGIIEAHHGKLYLESNTLNTTFVIELPKKHLGKISLEKEQKTKLSII